MNITYSNYGFKQIIRLKNKKQKLIKSFVFEDDYFTTSEMFGDLGELLAYDCRAKRFYEEIQHERDIKKINAIYEKYKDENNG